MSKSVILTPAHIDRLKSGSLSDREVPGLAIVVPGLARKQWRFKRCVAGTKKTVELILGCYPAFSIDEARAWAAPLSRAVARGKDPREIKRADEARAMSIASAHAIYMDAMRRPLRDDPPASRSKGGHCRARRGGRHKRRQCRRMPP